jgi:hypothetical protein
VTYLGGLIQIRVRLASGEILKIAVPNAGGFRSLPVGSPAHVTFDAADVVVLTDAGAGAPATTAVTRASGAVA